MYIASGHYRQPLAFSEEELLDAGRRVDRIREALAHLTPGEPSPADMAPLRDAFFDALARDFNTPAALASLFEWVREANRRGRRSGGRRPPRDAPGPRPGLAEAARSPRRCRGDRPSGPRPAGAARASPCGPRFPDRRSDSRAAPRAWVGDPRRPRRAQAVPGPGPVILYGRNPVREALRGRRSHMVGEVWVAGGAAREPWLEGVPVRSAGAQEIEARCGSEAHQGICAEAGSYPYVGAHELLGPRAPAAGGPRPDPGPPEPRLDLPHRRVRRGRRRGDPRTACGRGHPRGLQGLGRGRRASADRPRAQPDRLPARGPRGRLLVLRRQRRSTGRPAPFPTTAPTTPVPARSSSWAARAAVCARGWRGHATS